MMRTRSFASIEARNLAASQKFHHQHSKNNTGRASHEKLVTIVVDKNNPKNKTEAEKAIKDVIEDAGLA